MNIASSARLCRSSIHVSTHRTFVLDEHSDPVRSMLGQLLHDLRTVDGRKEVSPREVGQKVEFFFVLLAIGSSGRPNDRLSPAFLHVILEGVVLWIR